MAKHYLFLSSGKLAGYETYADFIAGDILPDTVVFTGAMGRTEEMLGTIARQFINKQAQDALLLFEQVKQQHLTIAKYLLVMQYLTTEQALNDVFTELEWLLHDQPVRSNEYYTDQILVTGPLLNSILVAALFKERKKQVIWEDARDVLRTDDYFGNADFLEQNDYNFPIEVPNLLKVMPWQIASTIDNESTRYIGEKLISKLQQKTPEAIIQVL